MLEPYNSNGMDASQIEERLRTVLQGAEGVDAAYLFGRVLNTAPPDLAHRVLRDGKLVLDRDPSARIRFEVRARKRILRHGAHPETVPVRGSRSAPVTDPELIAKKLTLIETCVRELETLARPADIETDLEFSEALRAWIAAR